MIASLPYLIGILSFASIEGKLDLAAGPSFHRFDAPLSDVAPWVLGFNLDAGVAVSGETARAKAPRRFKDKIPKDGEFVVRPWWMAILPRQVVLSPGGNLSTLGFAWELFGISGGLSLGEAASLKAGIELPEIEWIAVWGPSAGKFQSLLGLGVSPDAHLQIDPVSWLRLDLGWAHHLDIPFGSLEIEQKRYKPWSWGSAYAQLHLRPGIRI